MTTAPTASTRTLLDQGEVERRLRSMGYAFEAIGNIGGSLRFASLRAPCAGGIYYLAAGAALPDGVSGSLILCGSGERREPGDNALIRLEDPKLAFYALMRDACAQEPRAGVHETAVVHPDADIDASAWVGPFCVVEADVAIGKYCHIDAHVVIKAGSVIGPGTRIEPHCTIGATGVAWAWDKQGASRVIQPQTGGVVIGQGVFIGSDVAVVRGSVNEMTEVGDGCLIAHGSKIGHGCRLGAQAHLANNVSLAGNVDTGQRVFFGSGAVVRPQVRLADDVVVGAGAVVTRDVDEPHTVVSGVPARPMKPRGGNRAGVPNRPSTRTKHE